MGVKVFLARGCRELVLVIKDEVGSVGSLEGKHRSNAWCLVRRGKGAKFKVERVEVGVLGFSKEK